MRPWGHSWLILESPRDRLEFGHTGDLGIMKLRYHEGVFKKIEEGDPNPIAYLWQTMADGQFQIGKPNRPPTFVWRMPITLGRYKLIHEYVMQRKYEQFGLRSNNCTDLVVEGAGSGGHQPDPPHSPNRTEGSEDLGYSAGLSGRILNTAS